jgi:hypothetical protein
VRDLLAEDRLVLEPRLVTEEGVGAATDEGDAVILEIFELRLKPQDFGRSYEREIERVEVQDVPLPPEVRALESDVLAVVVGG